MCREQYHGTNGLAWRPTFGMALKCLAVILKTVPTMTISTSQFSPGISIGYISILAHRSALMSISKETLQIARASIMHFRGISSTTFLNTTSS